MRKIVINGRYGGFSLSLEAAKELGLSIRPHQQKSGTVADYELPKSLKRDDPRLVEVVEKLGSKASGRGAQLKVVEVPEDVEWTVEEYDGLEHVAERHRTWR